MGAYSRILLPWDSQPQEAVGLSPMANGYKPRLIINGSQSFADNASGLESNPALVGTRTPTAMGLGLSGVSTASVAPIGELAHPAWTYLLSFTLTATPGGGANVIAGFTGSGDENFFRTTPFNISYYVARNFAGAIGFSFSSVVPVAGRSYFVAIRSFSNNQHQAEIWDSSGGYEKLTDATDVLAVSYVDGGPLVIGSAASNAVVHLYGVFDEVMADVDTYSLHTNPWQLFAPRSIWVPVSAATGGAYTLTADAGAYAIGGQDAALVKSRIVAAAAGAYSLAGQDATLTYAPSAGAYTLTAEPGAYVLAGQDAALKRGRVVTATAGAYALAGQDATLTYALANAYTLTCEAGAYAIGGQAATIAFSGATQATTGGWLGQRRRTKREIDNDWRKLVGLDPIEDEPDYLPEAAEVAEAVKPQRKTITVASLKPINVDNFVNAIKAKKRRRDEEFLLLMD